MVTLAHATRQSCSPLGIVGGQRGVDLAHARGVRVADVFDVQPDCS